MYTDPETGYNDHEDKREAYEARAAKLRESGAMNEAKWSEFRMFLAALTSDELARVSELADQAWDRANAAERAVCTDTLAQVYEREVPWPDSISIADWALTAFTPTKPASIASIGNGIYVKTGRRA